MAWPWVSSRMGQDASRESCRWVTRLQASAIRVCPRLVAQAKHAGQHDPRIVRRAAAAQMGEAGAEPGPAVDLGQQVGDAHGRQHGAEPADEALGGLGRDGPQGRHAQSRGVEPDVLERAPLRLAAHLGQPGAEQGAAVL